MDFLNKSERSRYCDHFSFREIVVKYFPFVLAVVLLTRIAEASEVVIGNTTITISVPAGYVNLLGVSPAFDQQSAKEVGKEMRLLAAFVTRLDAEKLKSAGQWNPATYLAIATPRVYEAKILSPEYFHGLASYVIDGQMRNASNNLQANSDRGLKLSDSDPKMPSRFIDSETAVGMVTLVTKHGALPVVMAMIVENVRGKPLIITISKTNYQSQADLEWVKSTAKTWVEEIERGNKPTQAPRIVAETAVKRSPNAELPAVTSDPAVVGACQVAFQDSALKQGDYTVMMRVLVGIDGLVKQKLISKSSGNRELDKAVYTTIDQCGFRPGTENGQVAERWLTFQYVWTQQ